MRIVCTILYWAICLIILATILSSLGYNFSVSMFVGSMFLPGLLVIKYFISQISFSHLKQGVLNICFLAMAVLVLTYLLLFCANNYLGVGVYYNSDIDFPPLLLNPVFILFVLAALALPEWLLDNFLKRREAARPQIVEFISDRRHLSMPTEEIRYVESLDSEVVVHTVSGEKLRTRTPISRWEATLNELHFIRIHRSYIVRRELIVRASRVEVELEGVTLPVSRKYAEKVGEI